MTDTPAVRTYTHAEHRAFRAVSHREWGQGYEPGNGPAEYAGGTYWPAELRAQAERMQRLIPLYRLAAGALEREIASDPRCAS